MPVQFAAVTGHAEQVANRGKTVAGSGAATADAVAGDPFAALIAALAASPVPVMVSGQSAGEQPGGEASGHGASGGSAAGSGQAPTADPVPGAAAGLLVGPQVVGQGRPGLPVIAEPDVFGPWPARSSAAGAGAGAPPAGQVPGATAPGTPVDPTGSRPTLPAGKPVPASQTPTNTPGLPGPQIDPAPPGQADKPAPGWQAQGPVAGDGRPQAAAAGWTAAGSAEPSRPDARADGQTGGGDAAARTAGGSLLAQAGATPGDAEATPAPELAADPLPGHAPATGSDSQAAPGGATAAPAHAGPVVAPGSGTPESGAPWSTGFGTDGPASGGQGAGSQPAVESAHIRAQVVRQLAAEAPQPGQARTLTLQLEPEHLGKVEVRITATSDSIEVVFRADSPEAQEALRESGRELARSLTAADARWQKVEVKVAEPSGQSAGDAEEKDEDGSEDRPRRDHQQDPRDRRPRDDR